MEYDYGSRKNSAAGTPLPYDPHLPMYHRYPSNSSSSSPSLYPKVGHGHGHQQSSFSPPSRAPPYHSSNPNPNPNPNTPSSSGTGIRVQIKPEYRITPPPQLLPHMGDIPHSKFQFDFEFERKVLAEAEKENQNWSRFATENVPSRPSEPLPSANPIPAPAPAVDPVVSKYLASGLNRQAVPLAVANFGDNPTKVREFANAYTQLRDMGFSSNNVAEALLMFDNDMDKALAHFLNSSS